jgi:hypothetical protein
LDLLIAAREPVKKSPLIRPKPEGREPESITRLWRCHWDEQSDESIQKLDCFAALAMTSCVRMDCWFDALRRDRLRAFTGRYTGAIFARRREPVRQIAAEKIPQERNVA